MKANEEENLKNKKPPFYEKYIKNYYEPFIMNHLSQFINLHHQYKVPINDFLTKAEKLYSDKILSNFYDVNDFINYKILTKSH